MDAIPWPNKRLYRHECESRDADTMPMPDLIFPHAAEWIDGMLWHSSSAQLTAHFLFLAPEIRATMKYRAIINIIHCAVYTFALSDVDHVAR